METKDEVLAELEKIRRANPDGLLLPEEVVKAARPATSPLHDRFDWDDKSAGHAFRLHQARMLIRVLVTISPANKEEDSRVFVSLSTDRNEGGGYRVLTEVLQDAAGRAVLLEDARRDMLVFKSKYSQLKELAEVFEAMEKTLRKK